MVSQDREAVRVQPNQLGTALGRCSMCGYKAVRCALWAFDGTPWVGQRQRTRGVAALACEDHARQPGLCVRVRLVT